jgi:polar amino acid transport system ATP-binding protein
MIALDRVTKRWGSAACLSDVSFVVDKGQVVTLVGPSGGGKSTLLRCINGLETFEAGEIRVDEDALRPGRPDKATLLSIRRKIGFVFQHYNLFAHRTALGNVIEAPVHVKKTPRADAEKRGRELLAKVNMSAREHAYPHELSGGEQQRVAIARALAMEPHALLLDEPTSALDPERKGEVLSVLGALAAEGTTMLIVTHEMRFAREVADRTIVLEGGSVVEDGRPDEVLAKRMG